MTGLSSFYLPEKLAIFIPVFATLERNTFGTTDARKRNMKHYLNAFLVPYFEDNCKKLLEIIQDEQQVEIIKKLAYRALDLKQKDNSFEVSSEVLIDIAFFYDAGHSFFDWNFKNITAMRYLTDDEMKVVEKFRKHLITEIDDMNSFILPPDE